MNYNDAVAVYQKSPTSETLKEVCKQLCSEMTLREKLKMLSGRQFAMRNCYDLLTKGRKYNSRPCIAGGIKRLEIPTVAFSDGPRGVLWAEVPASPFQWQEALRLTMSLNMRSAQPLQKK